MEKIQEGKITAITSSATLEEFAYVSLMRLIERKYNKHPKDVIRETPKIVSELAVQIEEMIITIISFENLEIIDLIAPDTLLMMHLMKKYALLPRDAVYVATMERTECKKIVSTDADFDVVKTIERLDPINF